MKKLVQYDSKTLYPSPVVGGRAFLMPLNHTNEMVSNKMLVQTSLIVSVSSCGIFETQNSIYAPSLDTDD